MTATPTAIWNAKADNPHYSICELTLPAFASTGLVVLRHATDLLPHNSGDVSVRAADQAEHTRVIAGRLVELEAGTELEIRNKSDQVVTFTVFESKELTGHPHS